MTDMFLNGDFLLVIRWWGTLFLIGSAAYPLTRYLFSSWWDRGYMFTKAVGLVVIGFLVWFWASLHIVPFSYWSIAGATGIVFICGMLLQYLPARMRGGKDERATNNRNLKDLLIERYGTEFTKVFLSEAFFFAALLFWAWVKGHEASIHGLEKFMDFGFTKSILNVGYFPPPDMWYAGGTVNYYYFGHFVMALLTRLSGIDLRYTFNLMLSVLFAFTATMSFSIAYQLLRSAFTLHTPNIQSRYQSVQRQWLIFPILLSAGGAVLTSFLVTMAGNMQTLYAFTRGYTGEDVKPFWELLWPLRDFWQKLPEGMQTYWYANATRFIPFTIHEFPSYSFVVSDVHGHVLSLPFVLLAIALLLVMFGRSGRRGELQSRENSKYPFIRSIIHSSLPITVFYGLLIAVLFMTNALDGPIYLGLFLILLVLDDWRGLIYNTWDWIRKRIYIFLSLGFIGIWVSPFLLNFSSFVNGIAINCPPVSLADTKFGLFIFEGVEKCQKSPFWMMWLLWGFFIFTGIVLILRKIIVQISQGSYSVRLAIVKIQVDKVLRLGISVTRYEWVLIVFFIYCIALIIFPEFFYFKDIYPAHFRSNTMFKLGYQAFIIFSIISGYSIITTLFRSKISAAGQRNIQNVQSNNTKSRMKNSLFILLLIPQLFLVCIYPFFSVRSYFNNLSEYTGMDGLTWFEKQYPDDARAVEWLQERVKSAGGDVPVIVEADGDSYTDYARVSAYTGFPSVIGWPVHEWLWRGTYDIVAPRREDVRLIYESGDVRVVKELVAKYKVKYIFVGTLEKEKYQRLDTQPLDRVGKRIYANGETSIWQTD